MFPPVTWNEEEVLQLIRNTQEEFLELDFKRGDSLKNTDQNKKEISKDVSAFANTIGGTIVYGIEEDLQPPHAAVSLSPINLRVTTKEWLEQVINSNIQPRIPGIRITPINLTSVPDSAVYVVTIPEGATAYQAADKRYYKRFNFESVPMYDYEIRQILNSVGPDLWTGQSGKELVLAEPFLHPETERHATEIGRCGSGVWLEHRSIAWSQVPCAEQWLTVGASQLIPFGRVSSIAQLGRCLQLRKRATSEKDTGR